MLRGKSVKKKLVSFVVMATLVLSAFNIAVSPNVVHAEDTAPAATAPVLATVNPVAISNGNKTITLTFDQPVALSTAENAPSVPVLIKRSGEGSFVQSNLNAASGVSVTGTTQNQLQFSYDTPLTGAVNQIRVQAGAIVNADASLSNATITTSNIVLPVVDATPPQYLGNEINTDKTKITLKFDEPIKNNAGELVANIYPACDCNPLALANTDPIFIAGNTIVITMSAALSEDYNNYNLNLSNVTDVSGNVSETLNAKIYPFAPKLKNSPVLPWIYDANYIRLPFDQPIVNAGSDAALKTAIQISNDGGVTYSSLDDNGQVLIQSSSENSPPDMIVLRLLPVQQTPGEYKVKVAAGAVVNLSGVSIAETVTPAFTVGDVTPPKLVDATVRNEVINEDDVSIVTLNFNESIIDNTLDGGTVSYLKNSIRLTRNNDYWGFNSLGGLDTVAIDSHDPTKLVITLHDPLVGNQNKIFVYGGALLDASDNAFPDIITHSLSAPLVDTAPQLLSSDITNKNHDLTFVFDENIQAVDAATLKGAVKVVSGYNFEPDVAHPFGPLGDNDTVTIDGNKLVIHFATALTDAANYVSIAAGTLKDSSNHQVGEPITRYFQPKDLTAPVLTDYWFNDSWTLSHIDILKLSFNKNLTDATIDAHGVSHLKEKISYTIDQGKTYLQLGPEDSAAIRWGDEILVMIHSPLSGQVIFKLDAGAVQDDNGNVLDSPVTVDVGQAPIRDTSANFFSDVSSELKFVDNPDWANKIQKIEVTQRIGIITNWNTRYPIVTLSDADYTIASGKITIKKGVFEKDNYYQIRIRADGYNDVYFSNTAHVSTESYYITPTKIDRTNGITAKVSIGDPNGSDGATVLFQLKKDGAPVSIVAMSASYLDRGIYTANFNVSDPAYAGYSVQAFVVSEYSNDPANVGISLSTEMSQADFDYWYWNWD
ncbi:hemoblobin-interacting domain-containing protein [Cohnella silvisoli]|uniref:hemoblobin-interacting domain-containing protein n=1 Tax=Cohnella silvisoli TaxID=2873699 RepID=UPI001E5EDEB4|nr:hemoblobin-interacting domain-containing protein [Cohnella silvisoli]